MREGYCTGEGKGKIIGRLVLAICLFHGGWVFAAESMSMESARQMVSLRHLSVEKADAFVGRLRLGTVSKVAGTNKVAVAGSRDELFKAIALLDVVDSETPYTMGKLGEASRVLPSLSAIEREMGSITIGAFAEPPAKVEGKDRVIIDVHRNLLVAVLPTSRVGELAAAVAKLEGSPSPPSAAPAGQASTVAKSEPSKTPVEPNQSVQPAPQPAAAQPTQPAAAPPTSPTAPRSARQPNQRATMQDVARLLAERHKDAHPDQPEPAETPSETQAPPQDLQAAIAKLMADNTVPGHAAAPPSPATAEPNTGDAPKPTAAPVAATTAEPVVTTAEPNTTPDENDRQTEPTPPAVPSDLQALIGRLLGEQTDSGAAEPAPAMPSDTPVTPPAAAAKDATPPAGGDAPRTRRDMSEASVTGGDWTRGAIKRQTGGTMEADETRVSPQRVGYGPPELPNAEDQLKITLPETMTIEQLLQLAGEYLHLDYMYEPQDVKQQVTLKLQGKLRGELQVKDLYPFLEAVLKFKGLVMTRVGNVVTVVPAAKLTSVDPSLMVEGDQVRYGDVVIMRVFTLKHIDTASAKTLLTTMQLGASISDIPENQTLIVTGYAYLMPRIEQLLLMIDKPGAPREFRFRQLKYTMAKALAPTIKSLAEQLGTVTVSVSVSAGETPGPPGETAAARRVRLAREAAARTAAAAAGGVPAAASPDSVYLDADERTNRILMIGDETQLEIVEQLIDTLDVSQADLRTMKTYKINHIDAKEVRKLLGELGVISATTADTSGRYGSRTGTTAARTTAGVGQPATPGAVPPPVAPSPLNTSAEGGNILVEEPQVVVLEATNSLLVNATAEQHAQLQTIVGYIDQMADADEIPYKIYPLENQKPSDLAGVLEKLIQETIKDKEGKVEQVIKRQDEEIVIVPDENTFSLIVYASKKNQDWISALIKQLDKRRPQVLIDVTLVEISKSEDFQYDLNALSALPDMMSWSGKIAGTPKFPAAGGDRTGFLEFASNKTTGASGFYGDKHINLLLSAMHTRNYGRVLAKPKILVNDNEKGTIKTTDTTYVKKVSTTPLGTGGSAGTDTTLIQTGVTYDPYDAGITLDITPHISEGDLLRLEVALTRSDFLDTADPDKPPNTTTSDVTTIVTVPDGSTIILGGMLKMNQSKGGGGVPVLMDVPVLGGLFRNTKNSDIQKKLYVFVRAEILRPDEALALNDLNKISERNRAAFEQAETEFQSHQDWPGFKPKPVAPAKVLEID